VIEDRLDKYQYAFLVSNRSNISLESNGTGKSVRTTWKRMKNNYNTGPWEKHVEQKIACLLIYN